MATFDDLIDAGQTASTLLATDYIAIWRPTESVGVRNVMATYAAFPYAFTEPPIPMSHLVGCVTMAAADTDHDVTVTPGRRRDSTDTVNMPAASGNMTKQIDAAWAAGDAAGGLFSGSVAANTTYHFFEIMKDSDNSIDYGWDTSLTAANIPTGYTYYRRIRSYRTDASSNLRQTVDYGGGRFDFASQYLAIADASSASTTQATIDTGVPGGLSMLARVGVSVHYNDNADRAVLFGKTSETLGVPSYATGSQINTATAARKANTFLSLSTDTSALIAYRASDATPDNFTVGVYGWDDSYLALGA